jgi:diguanylate cyclase (GGDEF)-like protein
VRWKTVLGGRSADDPPRPPDAPKSGQVSRFGGTRDETARIDIRAEKDALRTEKDALASIPLLEAPDTSDSEVTFVHSAPLPAGDPGLEASLLLIAHPLNQSLGARYRLLSQSSMVLGRGTSADISLPEVNSLSRQHCRLTYGSESVVLEDLGSTNGTYVNDVRISEPRALKSGDRFQAGGAHFKFLQDRDIENAYHQAIHELVILDGLTQIANKRRFEEEAERELGRARRYSRPLSMILFDVDRFKVVNDTHGHLCGDFVLKRIVHLTKRFLRREQLFARVGGEEFAILSPEADAEGSHLLAERVRSRIGRHEFAHAGTLFRVTCSFGVAALGPDVTTVAELYGAADRALYRSKDGGRNMVSLAGEPRDNVDT